MREGRNVMKNMEKKIYTDIHAEIIYPDSKDVVATSGFDGEDQFIKKASSGIASPNGDSFEL